MKEKIGLILGFILIFIGAVKFDMYIYSTHTLDYFGKWVAVVILNLFPFWIGYSLYKKNQWISLGWGLFSFLIFILL